MSRAQHALCQGISKRTFKTLLVHGQTSELVIEFRFLLEERLPIARPPCFMALKSSPTRLALFGRQIRLSANSSKCDGPG